jgi:hypothetical protein
LLARRRSERKIMTQVDTASLMDHQMSVSATLSSVGSPRPRHAYDDATSYCALTYAAVPGFRPLALDLFVVPASRPSGISPSKRTLRSNGEKLLSDLTERLDAEG